MPVFVDSDCVMCMRPSLVTVMITRLCCVISTPDAVDWACCVGGDVTLNHSFFALSLSLSPSLIHVRTSLHKLMQSNVLLSLSACRVTCSLVKDLFLYILCAASYTDS